MDSDSDFHSLMLACTTFAKVLGSEKSEVWKARFLAKYDHPIVAGPFDFRVAYQLRRFVLRHFRTFEDGKDKRARVQLEVLRDMVLGMCTWFSSCSSR